MNLIRTLSNDERHQAIDRLQKRLDEVAAFDPITVSRRPSAAVKSLEVSIDETLQHIFGSVAPRYRQYKEAAKIDRANEWFGSDIPLHDLQQGLKDGRESSMALLGDAIRALREDLAESHVTKRPVVQSTGRFSRRTLISAIDVMDDKLSQAALSRTLLSWGAEFLARCKEGQAVTSRLNQLVSIYDEDPAARTHDDDPLEEAIVEKAITLLDSSDFAKPFHAALIRNLEMDGFAVRDGMVIRSLPDEIELPQTEDEISRLLDKFGFSTIKKHLDQAFSAHGRGEWESANAQLRSFYEGLLDDIVLKLDPTASALTTSEARRARLAKIGFLSEALNEWGNDGKNYVNGLFKRLHPAGSHPGPSDEDDSTFRRHVVLVTAKLFLTRLDNWR